MPGQLSLHVAMTTIAFLSFGGNGLLAGPCDGSPQTLTVDYSARKLYSPGYPGRYDNNLKCEWLLEAGTHVRPGFGIQLATLELELDPSYATNVGECDDFLEVSEGAPSNQGPSLGTWCGRTLKIIKSMATSLTLRFSTNGLYTGKGFVIEYSLIRVASAECLPGRTTPVHVGRAPLYESFEVKNSESRCTWTVEAIDEAGHPDHDSTVVIEAFSVPKVFCENGKFIVYDGQSISSPKVLEWCDTDQAFSRIYLSSSYATLTFVFVDGEELNSDIDTVHLKIYTQNNQYECNEANLPSIDVGLDPVYFSLPFTKSSSGAACKVHVFQRVRDSVRLDVIGVRGQEIGCGSNIVTVKQASTNAEVEKSCSRRRHPMYLPFQSDVVVGSRNPSTRVHLRAVATDHFCDGREIDGQAYDTFITEKTLPRDGDVDNIQNYCYSKFLITAKDRQRIISLRLQWRPQADAVFSGTDSCEGDFVNVYDGNSESDQLLFSSCRKSDMAEGYVSTRLFSRQGQMLILFNTDEKNSAHHVNIGFYSIPATTALCDSIQEITVDRLPQNLTSLNYPDSYPLDYTCTYRLTANESDVVVVELVDTKFASGCGDILTIYDGISTTQPGHLLARICGHDTTSRRFVSLYNETTVKFVSNKFGPNPGGWRLLVYSEPRSMGAACCSVGSLVLAVLLVILCMIVLKV